LELADTAMADPIFTADHKATFRKSVEELRQSPQVILREKAAHFLKKNQF